MLLHLEKVLDQERLARVRELLAEVEWIDGRSTAQGTASAAKKNTQARRDDPRTEAAGALVVEALRAHPLFDLAVQPRAFSRPLFSQYADGMEYGRHLDAALMRSSGDRELRADVAVTLFLSDRASYDGGELVVENGIAENAIRGDAGECVIYPASSFHRVAPVTRGSRRAAVVWVESRVREPAQRQILYDLGAALDYLDLTRADDSYVERIRRSHLNLLRMWSDT